MRTRADLSAGLEQHESMAMYKTSDPLAEHIHEVPVHIVPCMLGRYEDKPSMAQSSVYGSIMPATWSFMLAARSRGLGTCWTTFHLMAEEEAAAILDIPYAQVTQVALIPVAYTLGTEFKPRAAEPLSNLVMWKFVGEPNPGVIVTAGAALPSCPIYGR